MEESLKRIFKRIAKNAGLVDPLEQKAIFAQRVRDCAEDGMVVIVSNGMDCDGVRYTGSKSGLIPAVPTVVAKEMDLIYEWADGPVSAWVYAPSQAGVIPRTSRDLGMEAFENGHPHVLYV